jgi:hypothetical protein
MFFVCLILYFAKREQQKMKKFIVFRLCYSFQCKLWKYNQICLLTTQEVFCVMCILSILYNQVMCTFNTNIRQFMQVYL